MSPQKPTRALVVSAAVAGLAGAFAMAAGRRIGRWGASEEEVARPLSGDDEVPNPGIASTRAISIHAPTQVVWPWLVQMGWGRVNETTAFKISAFEPNRWLLWVKPRSSWAWKLVPLEGGRTRLISRLKQRYDWRASPGNALLTLILFEFGDFPMMRKLFLNVKRRAQRLAIQSAAGAPAIGDGIR
jgi:hypothetical protein